MKTILTDLIDIGTGELITRDQLIQKCVDNHYSIEYIDNLRLHPNRQTKHMLYAMNLMQKKEYYYRVKKAKSNEK